MKSLQNRLEKLENKTEAANRPPAVVRTGEEPDLDTWEAQARQNMHKMIRAVGMKPRHQGVRKRAPVPCAA
ncbi:MAG: hypothetical protein U5K69_30030 [Balneolaceae bacterium]|nr:hypothetical protein [Balneolaceae bacterium]